MQPKGYLMHCGEAQPSVLPCPSTPLELGADSVAHESQSCLYVCLPLCASLPSTLCETCLFLTVLPLRVYRFKVHLLR